MYHNVYRTDGAGGSGLTACGRAEPSTTISLSVSSLSTVSSKTPAGYPAQVGLGLAQLRGMPDIWIHLGRNRSSRLCKAGSDIQLK